jgi:hypothetical protein
MAWTDRPYRRREDGRLLFRHLHLQERRRPLLGAVARSKGHHVRKEGPACEAGGLQQKGRQPVGHRQLRRDRRRQLRGHVALRQVHRHAQVQVVR